jgi:hypothetical protein
LNLLRNRAAEVPQLLTFCTGRLCIKGHKEVSGDGVIRLFSSVLLQGKMPGRAGQVLRRQAR